MGHVLLGNLPRTRRWQEVVQFLEGGASAAQIAAATINAAEKAFSQAVNDVGVIETVWLLTKLPLAARSENFLAELRGCGLEISNAPGLLELTGAVSDAIDRKLANCKGRSDLGEMAQMAAAETLTTVIGSKVANFFGTTVDDVKQALAATATNRQFSTFAKEFFSRFTTKLLNFYVSKVVAQNLGTGQRYQTLTEQRQFSEALDTHCREACRIVEDYSGGWVGKANYETGGQISRGDIKRFVGYAMTKLTGELSRGGGTR